MTAPAPATLSITRQIFEIRSFPNVKPKWDRLSTDEKRAVLRELEGDINERWALQVIKDIREVSGRQLAVGSKQ
jgi:hypothetical protein